MPGISCVYRLLLLRKTVCFCGRLVARLESAGYGRDAAGSLFRPMACKVGPAADWALRANLVYRDVVRRHAERSVLVAEVEGLGPHALRATAAASALGWGVPPLAMRGWLGHASLTATAQCCRPVASDGDDLDVRVSCPKAQRRSRQ